MIRRSANERTIKRKRSLRRTSIKRHLSLESRCVVPARSSVPDNDHALLADRQAFAAYLAPLRNSEWVVYSKRPFGGPNQVLRYLARYTHRVAISNRRLCSFLAKHI